MTPNQRKALATICTVVLDATQSAYNEGLPCPSGHVYAALMSAGLGHADYMSMLDGLTASQAIVVKNHCLTPGPRFDTVAAALAAQVL